MNFDLANSLFEFGGAIAIARNCLLVYNEKMVRGISVLATSWFCAWSLFNLLYYPQLGQNASTLAASLVVTMQSLYVGLLIYYRWFYKDGQSK